MDYFESNMNCLKENREELYKKLDNYINEHTANPTIIIESEQALDGELYLLVQKSNALHRLNSSYSPRNEAERWVEQYKFTNLNIVISLFGLGNGYFVRELAKNKGPKDIIVVYEPSVDILYHVLLYYDITDIIREKSIILTIEEINEFDFHQAFQYIVNITNINSQINCVHPGYEDLFPEQAIFFWKEIKDALIRERTNINTERYFGRRYITNGIFNLRYLKESNRLMDIKDDINTDIPAIIVAAGPSLKGSIDYLRKAKGKAYVFAVDRILDYLLDAGIEPDFIVTVDPIKPLEYFTTRTDVTIPLLCSMDSNWEVLQQHKGKKIFYSCNQFYQRIYLSQKKEPPLIFTGASVATTAFSACLFLGFKKIALVGQDLAYDGELTHAGVTALESSKKRNRSRDLYVDGIDGEKILSRTDWYQFLIWFKDAIILYPNVEVFDTKDRGAKIEGAIQMSLNNVIDKYGVENGVYNSAIYSKGSTFSEDEMKGIRKYLSDTYDELQSLKRKAKDAIKICEEQIRIYNNNFSDNHITEKNFNRISKINKFIYEQPAYHLIDAFITAEATQQISELYNFTDDEIQDKIKTYEKSIAIFNAIIEGSDFTREVFDENMEYI